MSPSSSRAAALLVIASMVSAPVSRFAHAEPSATELASARDFMKEGKELRAAGDHAGALKKFMAAYAIVATPITGVAVAEEQIALGQLVEARETLGAIGRMPVLPNETDAGRKARDDAATVLADLLTRIPVVEVHVTGAAIAETKITIDGSPVPSLSAEQGIRVNPGTHEVVASAPGVVDQRKSIDVKEKDRARIDLAFPSATATAAPATTTTSPDEKKPLPLGTVGLVAGGAGVVLIGVGGVLALAAKSSYSSAKDAHCPSGVCDAEGKQLTDSARSRAATATIVMSIGAVVAVGGAVLFFTAPKTDAQTTGLTHVSVGLGTIGIGGAF